MPGRYLPHHSAGCPALWRRDLGRDPTQYAASGRGSPQVDAADLIQATQAVGGQYLGVPPIRLRYSGIRVGINGDLHLQAPEYGPVIQSNAAYSVTLPGGGLETSIAGSQEVMGAGGTDIFRLV